MFAHRLSAHTCVSAEHAKGLLDLFVADLVIQRVDVVSTTGIADLSPVYRELLVEQSHLPVFALVSALERHHASDGVGERHSADTAAARHLLRPIVIRFVTLVLRDNDSIWMTRRIKHVLVRQVGSGNDFGDQGTAENQNASAFSYTPERDTPSRATG